ncbi:MAG: hypothetical protein LBU34_05995 [Planctomycetaceae bacterium]|jgi:hypothetical protein|nr:hypothetical protein [Planctomycetaceae bacterium]
MTAKHSFIQKPSVFVMLFCALCLFALLGTKTNSNANTNPETVHSNNSDNSFQQQLLERSQKYLDSIQNQSANLSPELQEKFKRHAQNTVVKGLAKLNHSAKLAHKQAGAVDLTVVANAVQKTGKHHALKVAAFLSRDFYRATELEVAVRVALPTWDYRHFGRLTAKNSGIVFGLLNYDSANCTAIVVPASPRNSKTFAKTPGQSVLASSIQTKSFSHRFTDNNDILPGFTLIAQTVIRRE